MLISTHHFYSFPLPPSSPLGFRFLQMVVSVLGCLYSKISEDGNEKHKRGRLCRGPYTTFLSLSLSRLLKPTRHKTGNAKKTRSPRSPLRKSTRHATTSPSPISRPPRSTTSRHRSKIHWRRSWRSTPRRTRNASPSTRS